MTTLPPIGGPGTAPPWLRKGTNWKPVTAATPGATMSTAGTYTDAQGIQRFDERPWVPNAGQFGALTEFKPETIGGVNYVGDGHTFAAEGLAQGGDLGFNNWAPYHEQIANGVTPTTRSPMVPTATPTGNFADAIARQQASGETVGSMPATGNKGGGVADFGPLAPTLPPQQAPGQPGAPIDKPAPINKPGDFGPLAPNRSLTGFKPVMPASGPMAGAPGGLPSANPGLTSYANSTPAGNVTGTMAGTGGGSSFNPSAMFGGADFSGLPGVDTDYSGQAQRGAEAAYRGATQFFDPDFTRDTNALENRLMNQGFARGSEAFNEEMGRLRRSQMAARQNAAFQAQGVGHQQAGDLLLRALQTRGQLVGERERGADRNLGRYGIDTNAELSRRGLGLGEDNQAFQQLMQIIAASRGGVNMPNFGAPAPLDVGSAYGIAGRASEADAARRASDRAGMYALGASALGSINWADLFKQKQPVAA